MAWRCCRLTPTAPMAPVRTSRTTTRSRSGRGHERERMVEAHAFAHELRQAIVGDGDVHPLLEAPALGAVGADLRDDDVDGAARLAAARVERDRAWLNADRQAIVRGLAFDGIDSQRHAEGARVDRARDRGVQRCGSLRARLLLRRHREIPLPVACLEPGSIHLYLEAVETAVPAVVGRVVAEHVGHPGVVARAPDRSLNVVGVDEGPAARLFGDAVEDVLVQLNHRQRRRYRASPGRPRMPGSVRAHRPCRARRFASFRDRVARLISRVGDRPR